MPSGEIWGGNGPAAGALTNRAYPGGTPSSSAAKLVGGTAGGRVSPIGAPAAEARLEALIGILPSAGVVMESRRWRLKAGEKKRPRPPPEPD
jgi:hypothetical protein